jgi:stress-induced-phosphoprotein 1
LYGLGDYAEAKISYQKVLELEPGNVQASKALKEIDEITHGEEDFAKDFQNMFDNQRILEKMMKNPKLAAYMAQPDFVKKLNEIQKDPKSFAM